MLRLTAALLATWLALLGAATPALACAASAPVDDCCPDGVTAPCATIDPAVAAGAALACCAEIPGPAQSAAMSPARVSHEVLAQPDSPDLPILPFPTISTAAAAVRLDGPLAFTSPRERDSSRTYLHTLRLRL